MINWHVTDDDERGLDHYRGLTILADGADVHEKAMELLSSVVSTSAPVLDVAAGSGAFTRRLLDHGFESVEAIELRQESFGVDDVPVHPLDLDGPWGDEITGKFGALVAIEIIEHLENPWHFARQCAAVVEPGGVVLVTTPNIESSRSRIEFLLQARFRFFRRRDYLKVGHLTNLTSEQMEWVFERAGFEPLARESSRHKGLPRPTSPRRAYRALLYALSYPFMRGARRGEVSLFLFRRTAPES